MTRRKGFTLIEIMMAVTILLVVMGLSVQFFRRQTNAVSMETHRMDALQNAEFSVAQIERELREAGAGVADRQPMIVQLDSMGITFNANLLSLDSGDVRAVYQSSDADPAGVRAMLKTEALPLPNSNKYYPDSTYFEARGFISGAETIAYYLTKDSAATTNNTYALWRRVNALPATLISRNLRRTPGDTIPFFTYFMQDTLGHLVTVAQKDLPLYHTMIHGASNDTGKGAITDSIRAVRLHFVAVTIDQKAGKDSVKYRIVESRVRILNSGLLQLTACGQPPLIPGAPVLTQTAPGVSPKGVTLTWARSGDDGTGEKDLERYAIFRRLSTATQNGDPISSIPAKSATSYSYTDYSMQAGVTYVYGVAGQDCTPNVSDVAVSLPITVTNP